nr:YihA family ribosome biogenesis GTP-binding protein [Lachnospiraceae bacterium]
LRDSKQIKLIMLLVDIRHSPNSNDKQMLDWCLSYGYNPVIIATKADKIKRSQLQRQTSDIKKTLGLTEETPIVPYSSLTRQGLADVFEYIDYIMELYNKGEI